MPRVMLNGQDYVVQPTPLNWSELLTSLDRDLEPRGFLVTAIRVDGVDQPGFRDEDRLAGALDRDAVDRSRRDARPTSCSKKACAKPRDR